jgi:hypothetical protein
MKNVKIIIILIVILFSALVSGCELLGGSSGACVASAGACEDDIDESDCENTSRKFYEDKTCSTISPKGACIASNGSCESMEKLKCEYHDLEFVGGACDDITSGACIDETGNCISKSESECESFSYTYIGGSCDDISTGACINDDLSTCSLETEYRCDFLAGYTYQGGTCP